MSPVRVSLVLLVLGVALSGCTATPSAEPVSEPEPTVAHQTPLLVSGEVPEGTDMRAHLGLSGPELAKIPEGATFENFELAVDELADGTFEVRVDPVDVPAEYIEEGIVDVTALGAGSNGDLWIEIVSVRAVLHEGTAVWVDASAPTTGPRRQGLRSLDPLSDVSTNGVALGKLDHAGRPGMVEDD